MNIIEKLLKLRLSHEDKLFFRKYGVLVSKLRRDAVFQARLLHGIAIPPHERVILRPLRWRGLREYHLIGGRGTAKSFTVCSMEPTLKAEVFGKRKIIAVSASKFRGGKTIMEEATSLIKGHLFSQKLPGPFVEKMIPHPNVLKKEPDRWYIQTTTKSVFMTIPTGNDETIRGQRAQELYIDEADNWEQENISKIVKPFLAVGTDFEKPGSNEDSNKLVQTGTVSHIHKDWAKNLLDHMTTLRKRYEASLALQKGDFETYENIITQDKGKIKLASVALQRWDYTDLLLSLNLKEHKIHYPYYNKLFNEIEVNPSELIKWDEYDNKFLIYTYPVQKQNAEDELRTGVVDFDTWASEWRCQFIETSGNVYPYDLIERATSTELLTLEDAAKKGWDPEERGQYYPPLLYECSDPCVLGFDPARTNDFAAFVVIRIGELAKGEYNPITGTGETPWNNVIWAEQHKHLTIKQMAIKINELRKRYNFVTHLNPALAPAIVIDARGAASGTTVRDELARPTPEVDDLGNVNPNWVSPQKIYDPTDDEYKMLRGQPDTWPGLRLFWTSDQENTELVSFTKGQMEARRLYIARKIERKHRIKSNIDLDRGYIGVHTLRDQLLAIQATPTKYHQTFDIPGNKDSLSTKKDLFSAFLYASYALRQHLAQLSRKPKIPTTIGIIVNPGGGRRDMFGEMMKW